MLKLFGNSGASDMPAELWLDVELMQELYRLRDIDSYGKVAPSRLAATTIIQEEAAGNYSEDTSVRSKQGTTT